MLRARSLPLFGWILFAVGCTGDDTVASPVDSGNNPSLEAGDGAHGEGGGLTPQMGQRLPTGDFITPTAARGSTIQSLSPSSGLLVDHAITTVVSHDGKTLLVLTSGYNQAIVLDTGSPDPARTGEWIFIYDLTGSAPVQKQVLQIANSYAGIAFHPGDAQFYVAGGQDDNVHVFAPSNGTWSESGDPIALGHVAAPPFSSGGLGLQTPPESAGIAVDSTGSTLVVANYENDSISIVDLATRSVRAELDLRPGKAASQP